MKFLEYWGVLDAKFAREIGMQDIPNGFIRIRSSTN